MWEGDSLKSTILSTVVNGRIMTEQRAKQIVYRYNGHISSDEIQADARGDLTFAKGDIVRRPGKNWRVESVQLGKLKGDLSLLPSLLVNLVDNPIT